MSPYELENLPHTLKRVRTQPIFVRVLDEHIVRLAGGINRNLRLLQAGACQGTGRPACLGGDRIGADEVSGDARCVFNDSESGEYVGNGILIMSFAAGGIVRKRPFYVGD